MRAAHAGCPLRRVAWVLPHPWGRAPLLLALGASPVSGSWRPVSMPPSGRMLAPYWGSEHSSADRRFLWANPALPMSRSCRTVIHSRGPGAYGYIPCLSGLRAVRLGGDPRDSTVVSRWDRRRPKTIGENLRRCQGGWLGGGSPKGEPPNHLDIGVKSDPPPRHSFAVLTRDALRGLRPLARGSAELVLLARGS